MFRSIVEKCIGCEKIGKGAVEDYCTAYSYPDIKWLSGNCPMATHLKRESVKVENVNFIKHSKHKGK